MRKTYTLSCHCGKVRAEATADLSAGTGKCNCSICAKLRGWGAIVQPSDFRLLTDEADLGDYQWGAKIGHHHFCKHCGLHVFGQGDLPELGGAYVSIRINAIDDISPEELATLPVGYFNGRDNDWMNVPKVTAYL
jgi:hypothetical protein